MLRTIVEIIALVVLIYIAVGIRIQLKLSARQNRRLEAMSTRISALLVAVTAQTTVVAGVATAFAGLTATVKEQADALRDAGVDTTGLDAAIAAVEENTAKLSQAVAIDTEASDEVLVDEGGTGDETSAVEPAPAPIPDADGDGSGEGGDAAGETVEGEGQGEGDDAGGEGQDGSGEGEGAEGEGEGERQD